MVSDEPPNRGTTSGEFLKHTRTFPSYRSVNSIEAIIVLVVYNNTTLTIPQRTRTLVSFHTV